MRLGLQKVGKFPVNFRNLLGILVTYREFWNFPGFLESFRGNLLEMFHPFATLVAIAMKIVSYVTAILVRHPLQKCSSVSTLTFVSHISKALL